METRGLRMDPDPGERGSGVTNLTASGQRTCLDNPVIAENLEAIRALCREFGVVRLEVFGSVCTPDFDPDRSDVDFLIEYPPDYDYGLWLTRYFALKDDLETLLGRSVDLVMIGAPRNKYFVQSMNETRQLIYAT